MKEFVEKLRAKADTFEKSGCAVDGIVKDYRKSADMIEGLYEKSNISGFVEKLIERLEEEKEENPCRNMKCKECQYTRNCYEGEKSSEVAIDNVIKIVNQLAEEYKYCIKMCDKDCEVYDKENHYCPKWCKLIRETVAELKEEYNQDSTKKNQGWILCSEKLPEERSWYLALFKESSTGFVGLPYIADYLMGNHTSWTTKDGWIIKDCTDTDNVNEYFKDLECVAWQSLPNPCSFTHEKELVEFCKPEEKSKFRNEELDAIMDKILDTTQEEPQPNFYSERFNRVM